MTVIRWLIENWKLVASAAALVLSYLAGASEGSDRVQRSWDIQISLQMKEEAKARAKNQQIITQLEVKKHENERYIDNLRKQLDGFRVRLPDPPKVNNPASGSENAATGCGVSAEQAQTAINRFTDGLAEDAYEIDGVIESCRVLRDWAASLPAS